MQRHRIAQESIAIQVRKMQNIVIRKSLMFNGRNQQASAWPVIIYHLWYQAYSIPLNNVDSYVIRPREYVVDVVLPWLAESVAKLVSHRSSIACDLVDKIISGAVQTYQMQWRQGKEDAERRREAHRALERRQAMIVNLHLRYCIQSAISNFNLIASNAGSRKWTVVY